MPLCPPHPPASCKSPAPSLDGKLREVCDHSLLLCRERTELRTDSTWMSPQRTTGKASPQRSLLRPHLFSALETSYRGQVQIRSGGAEGTQGRRPVWLQKVAGGVPDGPSCVLMVVPAAARVTDCAEVQAHTGCAGTLAGLQRRGGADSWVWPGVTALQHPTGAGRGAWLHFFGSCMRFYTFLQIVL